MSNIIFVLTGGVVKDENGAWRSSLFEHDECALIGSSLRVHAAFYRYQELAGDADIIVSGGRGTCDSVLPKGLTLAEIVKGELMELGVLPDAIEKEEHSDTTYEQLKALALLLSEHAGASFEVITNEYHILRTRAMIEHAPGLQESLGRQNVSIVAAEDILLTCAPRKWSETIDDVKTSPEVQELIAREKKGVKQIKEGSYAY